MTNDHSDLTEGGVVPLGLHAPKIILCTTSAYTFVQALSSFPLLQNALHLYVRRLQQTLQLAVEKLPSDSQCQRIPEQQNE